MMHNHWLYDRCYKPLSIEKHNQCPVADDNEKVATASVDTVQLGETSIISRYGKHYELMIMIGFWLRLAPEAQKLIDSIFCDSKCSACYSLKVKLLCPKCAMAVGLAFDEYLCKESGQGGHNGICVEFGKDFKESDSIDPDWELSQEAQEAADAFAKVKANGHA